jgi:RTX calcium-binding nonapeptide repeat (4 copies)
MSQGRFARRSLLASLVTVAALTASASPAGAAVTIGQTAPPAGAGDCGGAKLYVTSQVAPGSPTYVVPPGGGVLTEWSATGGNIDSTLELKVVNQTAAMNYRIVATDVPRTLFANVLNNFPIRIPVSGGEFLSLWVSATGQFCAYPADPGDVTEYRAGSWPEPNVGDTFVMDTAVPNVRINATAVLEPDCDEDGLGDQTQDGDLSTCAPGTAPTGPAPTPPGAAPATCKGKPATIVGTNGNDVRTASRGQDVIVALGGNDTLSGLGGNDVICGGAGKDSLKGGKGKDSLLGQKGKDALNGGPSRDLCKGGKGTDTASKCEVEKSI